MSKIEKLVLDKYKEPIENSEELVDAKKYFNGNYTKIENKVNEVIDNTDTRLNTLETDNTNNKQDILSIQQEQINQNDNISQNKTDIELLEENLADEITTEEAESLTVKDSTRWYGKLDVSGNSVQESRSGKNLVKILLGTETRNGITVTNNGDGSLTINGTSTANSGTYFNINTITENKTFAFSIDNEIITLSTGVKLPAGITFTLRTIEENQTFLQITEGKENITGLVSTKGKGMVYIGIQAGATINNLTIYPMAVRGGVENLGDFELYGAMPSPTISSEIRNCGDNVNIFDGQLEQGTIDTVSGMNVASNSIIRSKNYIEIPERRN